MDNNILKIKVLVDGKIQELEVGRSEADAEELVREAAKRLNSTLFEYRKNLKLDDANDYLRLVALQYAAMVVEREYKDKNSAEQKQLFELEARLEGHLEEIKKQ